MILSSAAVAERNVLYSCDSCCTGSKKFCTYSMKANSVPIVTSPLK